MAEPKRHHLVPEFYLRRFANGQGRIALHRRATGQTKTISVRDAAVGVGFYTVLDEQGTPSQRVETSILQKLDDRAATALRRLASGPFPPAEADRSDLAMFIAFQALRGPAFRHQVEAVGDITAKLLLQHTTREDLSRPLEDGRIPSEEEVEAALFVIQNPDKFTFQTHQNERIQTMLSLASKEFFPRIFQMSWILARCRKPRLLTTDNPVVYWRQRREQDRFPGVGLATADEVRFPLDPYRVLVLVPDRVPERVLEIEPHTATMLARHVAAWSFDHVFHHPKHDPLRGFVLDKQGPRVQCPSRLTKPRPQH